MAQEWFAWRSKPLVENGTVTPDNILDNPEGVSNFKGRATTNTPCCVDPNEEIYRNLMPHSNMCEDRSGRPLYYEQTGAISSKFPEIIKQLTVEQLVVRHVRQQEMMTKRLHHASQKHGRPIEKQVLVFNLENLSYAVDTNAMSTFRQTVVIDEAYYPERLHRFYMINAPW